MRIVILGQEVQLRVDLTVVVGLVVVWEVDTVHFNLKTEEGIM